LFSSLGYHRTLHSFPTRRSSDLTVLMLDDLTTDTLDKTVHSVAHGVIRLEELAPNYGAERRRLRIVKYRGQSFRGGYHDFSIRRSEEHTSELQSRENLVCRLLLE